MVDYRNCTDNMFNSAMAMKNKDVDKIPTNYLYILYTGKRKKYPQIHLSMQGNCSLRKNSGKLSST